eukprot:768326-Hanusia_phi.AAC.2
MTSPSAAVPCAHASQQTVAVLVVAGRSEEARKLIFDETDRISLEFLAAYTPLYLTPALSSPPASDSFSQSLPQAGSISPRPTCCSSDSECHN